MSIRERLSGNEAVAYAMKQINPDVMGAFPITPSTEIPQYFAQYVANGEVDTEYVTVESEHSSMSTCIGAAAAVVAGTHAANLILDKKYGKNRAATIIGPKGDHTSYRTGKNLSGTKISSSGVMTGHKWFTNYSLSFKNKLNKKTGQIENTKDFNRGINWAKAFGLAAGLGLIGSTVAKVLTKNKQKENDYVVKQQINEVSNQKELDYYKKTGKLPKSTKNKRR